MYFCYDFISIFFIRSQYMIHDGKRNMDWKNYNKYSNQQITMDFWMTKLIWTLFSKVSILVIFCWIDIFLPLTCIIKSFLDGEKIIWTSLIDWSPHKAHSTLVLNIFFHYNVNFPFIWTFGSRTFVAFELP
jgi:hypothetical protein